MTALLEAPRISSAPPTPKKGWDWPKGKDPRIPFASLLALYAVLGTVLLGFNRNLFQIGLTTATACALDMLLAWVLRRQKVVPLSALISGLSLSLLLNYAHDNFLFFFPVLLAIGSKYLFTFQGRHIFNPSLFGVAVSLLATNELITAAPAYQWGGTPAMSLFIAGAALCLFVFRVGKGWLVGSFLVFYALQTGLRAWILRHHLPPEALFLGTLTSAPFFLFTFYMITDPATSPKTPRGQVIFALLLTLVDLWLHTKQSVYTFFYAAFLIGTAKGMFLHARAGLGHLRLAWRGHLKPLALVLAIGVIAAGTYRYAIRPTVEVRPVFSFEPVRDSGITSEAGNTLREVDPRLAHIAKWILSVGDSVAVGDVDGDGRMDLFFTHPLKRPEDRTALYRNLGDFRFARVPLPDLERYNADPKRYGLASQGILADVDNDGDADLFVAYAFGSCRLFRNDGGILFTEIDAGLDEHSVSLAANLFDFDRDGKLDLLVANALTPDLPGYARPTKLNIFDLPQPEYPGDRRMFRFMHNGWHNADNGGRNRLYRNAGGRFERLESAALGMPETHWSLAVATGDFNRDGWTDLYVASDFGRDDLYLNKAGRGFERVEGRWFGEVGRDTYKGMNATVADFDRNGWMDVYVSNVHHSLQAEGSLLWMTRPSKDPFRPRFTDEAMKRGALNDKRFGWGAAAGDLDNDGWLDLVQANGMVDDRLDPMGYEKKNYWYVNHKLMQSGPEIHTYADMWGDIRGRTIYPNEKRRVYLNRGNVDRNQFVDVADQVGLNEGENSRGVALVDLDNDGDLDLVITNQHGPVSLYRNSLSGRSWVGLELVGSDTSRFPIGTRVEIRYGNETQAAEVQAVNGFSAQKDPRLHFGLGPWTGPVTAKVTWYRSGETRTYTLRPGEYHRIQEER